MGVAAVAAAGLFAGGLWWDQERVNKTVEQATSSAEKTNVEPSFAAAKDSDDDDATTETPSPEPEPEPAEEKSPAPEPELAPVTQDPIPQAVQLSTAVPVPVQPAAPVPVQPAAPRAAAPVQQPEAQSPADTGQTNPGAATENGEGQNDRADDTDTDGQDSQPPGGGTLLDRVFAGLAN